jgi:renalase
MKCAIVGAGLAGLSCAEVLRSAGHDVTLFDKARGPGGRMSTRRVETRFGTAHIDHGAPCFHAFEPAFRQVVRGWQAAGLVQPWRDGGIDAWIGVPRMSAIVGHLAARHKVLWSTLVHGILKDSHGTWCVSSDNGLHGPFDAVIVAVPPEQAIPILALYDLDMAYLASLAPSRPCWVGLFVFEEKLPTLVHPRYGEGPVALAVCNRSKPERDGPEVWVVHASAEWSATHLEDSPVTVSAALLAALRETLNCSLPPVEALAHRWRYAAAGGIGRSALWNPKIKLGACGDWLIGPQAECAWMSGHSLACTIIESCLPGTAGKVPIEHLKNTTMERVVS